MTDQRLTDWVDGISLNLLGLEELEEQGGFRLDFSAGSLGALEARLLEYFGEPEEIDDPARRDLADGAAGYLGEVLLRLAGGEWGWRGSEPVVHADNALGLGEAYPRRTVGRAIGERTERVFATVFSEWEQAVTRVRAADPMWAPSKKHTPGVDPFEMTESDARHIDTWVSGRRAGFGRWRATFGTGSDWDFGPASLDALEGLLARYTPTSRDLYAPEHRELVDGAVWYFGETVRRIRGGVWVYRSEDPAAPDNVYAGDPYVQQAGRDGDIVMPILAIDEFVATGRRGTLRARHSRSSG
ncbi:hypothetical protein [Nocardia sp. NBC_00416]|uniref:hypothetical protein n=1 Tax=Nocardia sp. NBC_00416 TaxID=2975991 RepID=UPI002E1C5CB4